MLAAVEVHNKPVFAYRYEVSTMLVINAWELLLKAYIYKFLRSVKLFKKDGRTKDFDECIACIASTIGKDFEVVKESLLNLYEYRNKVTHFYCEDLDALLYSLLRANIGFYVNFLLKYFRVDLSLEANLILLPLGFTKPFSPVDFLSNTSTLRNASKEVREFIQGIIDSSKRLETAQVQDSILVEYRMTLINENRVKNADIVAAINNTQPQDASFALDSSKGVRLTANPDAKEVRVTEEDLYANIFTEEYKVVMAEARRRFKDFKADPRFNSIMRELKKDSVLHRVKWLDPNNPRSARKDWYSKQIYEELGKHYELRGNDEVNTLAYAASEKQN